MYQTLSLAGYLIAAGIERAGGQGRAQVCPTMPRAFLAAVYRSLSHLKASLTRCAVCHRHYFHLIWRFIKKIWNWIGFRICLCVCFNPIHCPNPSITRLKPEPGPTWYWLCLRRRSVWTVVHFSLKERKLCFRFWVGLNKSGIAFRCWSTCQWLYFEPGRPAEHQWPTTYLRNNCTHSPIFKDLAILVACAKALMLLWELLNSRIHSSIALS